MPFYVFFCPVVILFIFTDESLYHNILCFSLWLCSCNAALHFMCFQLCIFPQEGKRECTIPTLAFLPHCGKALYNNLLWRNLATHNSKGLSHLVLIGNSFSNMIERWESTVCHHFSWLRRITHSLFLPWVRPIKISGLKRWWHVLIKKHHMFIEHYSLIWWSIQRYTFEFLCFLWLFR